MAVTVDNLLAVALEAHHDENNHQRRYELKVGRDLFDSWTVAICFGRVGQVGQERRFSSETPDALRAVIRDRLRRRLSAPRRIGCCYRLASFEAAPGFDAAGWPPGDVMARFFGPGRP